MKRCLSVANGERALIHQEITPEGYDNVWAAPAGYAWTTVMDVPAQPPDQFLLNGNETFLSAETLERLQSPLVDTYFYGPLQSYGHGLFIGTGLVNGSTLYPQKMVSHGGDINGYATDFLLFPEQGLGIITLSGASGAHPSTGFAEFFEREGFYDNGNSLCQRRWNPLEELSIYAGVFRIHSMLARSSLKSMTLACGSVCPSLINWIFPISHPGPDMLDTLSWPTFRAMTCWSPFQKSRAASIRIWQRVFLRLPVLKNGPNEDVNRSHWSSASAEQEQARLIELFRQANEDFRLRKH